jgi:hypothetical protein
VVEEYSSWSSSLWSLLHFVTSSLLGRNILLNTLFSNTLSLRFSLNFSDQVPHPYQITGKMHYLFICLLVLRVLPISSFMVSIWKLFNCHYKIARSV